MSGYDPHFLVFKAHPNSSNIQGILAFNVDTMLQKQTERIIKVNLYHVSSKNKDHFEQVFSQSLEYIWNTMHCSVIRTSLFHFQDEHGKLQASAELKNLLKSKGFKWKTVTNDVRTG